MMQRCIIILIDFWERWHSANKILFCAGHFLLYSETTYTWIMWKKDGRARDVRKESCVPVGSSALALCPTVSDCVLYAPCTIRTLLRCLSNLIDILRSLDPTAQTMDITGALWNILIVPLMFLLSWLSDPVFEHSKSNFAFKSSKAWSQQFW